MPGLLEDLMPRPVPAFIFPSGWNMSSERKAVPVLKRAVGLPVFLSGLLLLGIEILWTTSDDMALPVLPPLAADAMMFLLGLAGMMMMYLGFRIVRGKYPGR